MAVGQALAWTRGGRQASAFTRDGRRKAHFKGNTPGFKRYKASLEEK